jgi:tetratricopeptide (TPR) repeat protein
MTLGVSAESRFFEGNEHFNNGKYQEAIEAYTEAIVSDGYSFAKLFNLGMAYKHNNNHGLALLNFERAKLLNPSKKVLSQINDIQSKLKTGTDIVTEQPQNRIVKTWLSLACVSFWLIIFLVAAILITRKFSKLSVVMAGFAFTALTVSLVETNQLTANDLSAAIVTGQRAELLTSPVSKSPKIGQVTEGEQVKASAGANNFVHIKSKNGMRGWVKNTEVEYIVPRS